ncbi:cytochrome P450 2A13-like [Dermacentor variabilis]|uniref:cytochrome P450 2A13-like n=1 Tax=Dermacentor variabilis TaxID=34621 RepID=UPI003F5C2173
MVSSTGRLHHPKYRVRQIRRSTNSEVEDKRESRTWDSLSEEEMATTMDCLAVAGSLLVASLLYFVLQRWLLGNRTPHGSRLPPGPPGYPLVGHPQFMRKDFHCNQAMKWAKQYGPIYRIKTGPTDMVMLNDFQSIKKFLTKREVLYRPVNWLIYILGTKCVATMNGELWEHNRRFCLHVLRNLGYGKTSMEDHIKDECQSIIDKVAEAKGAPIAFQDYLLTSTSNNISALVYGRGYPFDHQRRRFLDSLLNDLLSAIRAGGLVEFVPPFLLKGTMALNLLPFSTITAVKDVLQFPWDFVKKQIEEHKATLDEHFNRDFIDGYLKKIKEHEADPNLNFQQPYLLGNLLSFFIAGSNTVAVTLQWHVLNLADKPGTVQAGIRREIDEVVGKERQPAWEDRNKMPYTMACIWEMYRWKTVSPVGVPRSAGEDTFFDEYYIPRGTTICPNVWAVHNDPTLWKEPSKFDPGRFLSEDGSLIQPKPEYLIPFSIGKRMCPGEILASVEIFLYLTSLLQKYLVLPEGDKVHGLDSADISPAELQKYKVRFVPR